MSPAPPPLSDGNTNEPIGPAPWVAPDQSAEPPPAPDLDPLPPVADRNDTSGEPGPERQRRRDGRTTTVVLSVFAVVVLAVCGLLGVTGVVVNLPVHPLAGPPAAEEPQQDAPYTPDADQPATRSAPTPTPTRKPASTPSNGPGRVAVAYDVTGQGPVDIQYHDADGHLVRLEGVRLPWHRTIRTDDPSQAYVMANKADDRGERSIACSLTVGGASPVTESTGDGGWRVSCGG